MKEPTTFLGPRNRDSDTASMVYPENPLEVAKRNAGMESDWEPDTLPELLGGKYRVDSHLGSGGVGHVYLAMDEELNRRVALKILAPGLSRNPDYVKRFKQEAQLAAQLEHPHVVAIQTAGQDGDWHYIAMEYLEGGDVRTEMETAGGRLHPIRALHIGKCIGEALVAAHQKSIVHRDLKPDNFLLTKDGVPKLGDLGIAKQDTDSGITTPERLTHRTITGACVGTPAFMAPEQTRSSRVDHRADIYSLGASLFFMLTGLKMSEVEEDWAVVLRNTLAPYATQPLADRMPRWQVENLVAVITKMTAPRAAERYQTPTDLLRAFRGIKSPMAYAARRPAAVSIVGASVLGLGALISVAAIPEQVVAPPVKSSLQIEVPTAASAAIVSANTAIPTEVDQLRNALEEIDKRFATADFVTDDWQSTAFIFRLLKPEVGAHEIWGDYHPVHLAAELQRFGFGTVDRDPRSLQALQEEVLVHTSKAGGDGVVRLKQGKLLPATLSIRPIDPVFDHELKLAVTRLEDSTYLMRVDEMLQTQHDWPRAYKSLAQKLVEDLRGAPTHGRVVEVVDAGVFVSLGSFHAVRLGDEIAFYAPQADADPERFLLREPVVVATGAVERLSRFHAYVVMDEPQLHANALVIRHPAN